MEDLPAIIGKFAAFASEKPVKARTYEEIRQELIHSFFLIDFLLYDNKSS